MLLEASLSSPGMKGTILDRGEVINVCIFLKPKWQELWWHVITSGLSLGSWVWRFRTKSHLRRIITYFYCGKLNKYREKTWKNFSPPQHTWRNCDNLIASQSLWVGPWVCLKLLEAEGSLQTRAHFQRQKTLHLTEKKNNTISLQIT